MSEHDPELNALEASLRALAPRPALDRDRIVYEAGRASVRPRGAWPHACGALTLLLLVSLGWHRFRPEPPAVERIVYVQVPVTPEQPLPSEPLDPLAIRSDQADYLHLRAGVLRGGVDVLPSGPLMETEGRPLTPAAALDYP